MRQTSILSMGLFLLAAVAWGAPGPQIELMKSSMSPFVTFRVWVKAGSVNDPAGKEGLAYLTGSLIGEGSTRAHSYEEILRRLYPMAASYRVQVDREMTVMIGTCHKDHLPDFYALVKDALLAPAFGEADFTRLKTDQANFLEKTLRFNDDEELAKALLHSVAYEGTSYAHPGQGLVQSVKSLTLDDVRGFYRKYYTSSTITIGMAGALTDAFVEQVRRDMAALPEGAPPAFVPPTPAKKERALRVFLVEKETRATAISFGHPVTFTRADDDFYPLMIANSWLGEHRNSASHLYQVMREARGLNYGDYSYIEWFPNGGRAMTPAPNAARHRQMFEVWIRPVANANRHFALRQALREVTKLVENGVSRQSHELARNFLVNYSLNYAPTESLRLGYRIDDLFYGLSESHLDRIQKRVRAATLEQTNAAVRRHLDPGNLDIVMITKDAEAFRKALLDNASSPIAYDSPSPEWVLSEDKIIQDAKLEIKPENVRILKIDELFEK